MITYVNNFKIPAERSVTPAEAAYDLFEFLRRLGKIKVNATDPQCINAWVPDPDFPDAIAFAPETKDAGDAFLRLLKALTPQRSRAKLVTSVVVLNRRDVSHDNFRRAMREAGLETRQEDVAA